MAPQLVDSIANAARLAMVLWFVVRQDCLQTATNDTLAAAGFVPLA